jgi:hypothetical protein
MKKTTIVALILGVLVVISAVQAIQLNGLKTTIKEGELSIGSASTTTIPASSPGDGGKQVTSLPSNIKDLPQMVGGC